MAIRLFALLAALDAVSAVPVDSAMMPTYETLASHLLNVRKTLTPGTQHWVCIAGGPGSGKSTLSEGVAALINKEAGAEVCVVLPMDGFHYTRQKLAELDPPDASAFMPRRGSPWTFDAEGCYECFAAAKRDRNAILPTYSREISDPVPGGVQLKESHDIVLAEGVCALHAQAHACTSALRPGSC